MKPVFIGIAGGTGAGKSTLCTALMDKYHDQIGLIQLDDYFKPAIDIPKLGEHKNWDHPNSLYLDKLLHDLKELAQGKSVIIRTKNERLNPEYKMTDKRIPIEFKPKPVILVEGYLVLYDEKIRELLAKSIWLDVDHETRWARRVHFKYSKYEEEVLLPMHQEFAEPAKQYSTNILDVSWLTKEQVLRKVESIVTKFF